MYRHETMYSYDGYDLSTPPPLPPRKCTCSCTCAASRNNSINTSYNINQSSYISYSFDESFHSEVGTLRGNKPLIFYTVM